MAGLRDCTDVGGGIGVRASVLVCVCVCTTMLLCGNVVAQPLKDLEPPTSTYSSEVVDTEASMEPSIDPYQQLEASINAQQNEMRRNGELTDAGPKFLVSKLSFACDLPKCDDPEEQNMYLEVAGLKANETITSLNLIDARKRLLATQRFYTVAFDMKQRNDSVEIAIKGVGAKSIRTISFEGLEPPPFESELRKLLTYRRGQKFPANRAELEPQVASLKKALRDAGIFNVDVKIIVNEVEGEPFQVDLVYKFENGKRYNVCNVGFRGLNTLTYNEASDELLSDSPFLASRLNLYDLEYSAKMFTLGQEALLARYRQQGYLNARLVQKTTYFEPKSGCAYLVVDVSEGPKWEIVFEGNESFSESELKNSLPLLQGSFVDRAEIEGSALALQSLYQTRGYPFTKVEGKIRRVSEINREIIFTIDEGRRLEIGNITFVGNDSIPSAELQAQMGTKPYALFENGGYLQSDEFIDDLSNIEEFYHSRGYLMAQVEGFQFTIDPKAEKLNILIDIREGSPVMVSEVTTQGNRIFGEETLLKGLELQAGKPFTTTKLQVDLNHLKQLYSSYGYSAAHLDAKCETLEGRRVSCTLPRYTSQCLSKHHIIPPNLSSFPESVCKYSDDGNKITCRRYKIDLNCQYLSGINTDAIKVIYQIDEGPQITVGPILLQGNNLTRSSVIRRELNFKEGDFVDMNTIVRSQGNLRDLNVFDSVSIEPIGVDLTTPGETAIVAPILVSVEERRPHNILVQLGVEVRDFIDGETQYLLTGETSYTNRNLFGFAQSIQPHMIAAISPVNLFIAATKYFEANIKTPVTSLDFLVGAELTYTDPRFMKDWFGIDRLQLTISPYYLLDLVGITDGTNLREEWGIRTELRKYFYFDSFRIYNKLGLEFIQSTSHGPDDPVVNRVRVFSPRRLVGKLTPEIGFDGRDSPLNPTSGYFVRAIPEFFTGDALKAGRESTFKDSYMRLRVQGSYYFNFWSGMVLGQSLRYGQIIPMAGREALVPSTERFYLGGVRSVRGFPNSSLGPVNRTNQSPTGGEFLLNYNLELRYPIVPSIGLFGAAFLDSGILVDCRIEGKKGRHCFEDAFHGKVLEKIRTAAGLGIRFLILDQIPIVLDYGIVLNRQPTEKFGQLNFNIGYTFD